MAKQTNITVPGAPWSVDPVPFVLALPGSSMQQSLNFLFRPKTFCTFALWSFCACFLSRVPFIISLNEMCGWLVGYLPGVMVMCKRV